MPNWKLLALCGSLVSLACGSVKSTDDVDGGGDPVPDASLCTPEAEAELCAASAVECGPATIEDDCGDDRAIASCGYCDTALYACEQGTCVAPTALDWRNPANLEDVLVVGNTVAFSLALTPSRKLYYATGAGIGVYDLTNQTADDAVAGLGGAYFVFAVGEKIYFTDDGGDPRAAMGSVKVYDPDAVPSVTTLVDGLVNPNAVYVSPEGDVYIRNYDYSGENQNSAVRVLRGGEEPLLPIRENLASGQGNFGNGLWVEASGTILLPDSGSSSPGTTGKMLRLTADGTSISTIASDLSAPRWVIVDPSGDIVFGGLVDAVAGESPRGGLYALPASDPSTPTQIVERHVFGVAHGDGEIYYSTARSDPTEIRVIRNK
jgi:hypothetical protein